MRCVLSIEGIWLKDSADADHIGICEHSITQHRLKCRAAARLDWLCHECENALAQILTRLLNPLIARENRLRAALQFIVLRTRADCEELIIRTIAHEGNKNPHHNSHTNADDEIHLKSDASSHFLPLFQNHLSFP